jgi:hypothetical protein
MLVRVISGGQSGVDQAALRAAQSCGLETGGWCPPDRRCEDGLIPAHFGLQPTPEERSSLAPDVPRSMRSEWNVRDSDATLVLRPIESDREDAGTSWTLRCAARYGRPLLVCDPADRDAANGIVQWLRAVRARCLNVAGPSEQAEPGIGAQAQALLLSVFSSRS